MTRRQLGAAAAAALLLLGLAAGVQGADTGAQEAQESGKSAGGPNEAAP